MDHITAMLEALTELQAAHDARRLDYEAARSAILAPVQAALQDLDAEYQAPLQDLASAIAEQEAAVKAAVLTHGASVKGAHLQAVWSKGRVSWDTKKLDGLMIAVPQLAQCRSEGAPSVSIRKV